MGMIELLVALLATSILLLGAYQFASRTTRLNADAVHEIKLTGELLALKRKIEKSLRNLGYNPSMVPYPLCTGTSPGCVPDAAPLRIGITSAGFSRLEFTSDDNGIVYAGVTETSGPVKASERYAYWIASKTNPGTAIDFEGKTNPTAEPCTPVGASFTERYALFTKVKPTTPDVNANVNTLPTEDAVLADDVLCLEIRYYRPGDPQIFERSWVRLCNSTAIGKCPPDITGPPGPTNLRSREHLPLPPFPGSGATEPEQRAYFGKIRDDLRKIEMGILFRLKTGEVRRIHLETRLSNPPWRDSVNDFQLPSP